MFATFGETIHVARRRKGLTQEELARRIGRTTSEKTVGRWERGEGVPSAYNLQRLAAVLELDLTALSALLPSPTTHGGPGHESKSHD